MKFVIKSFFLVEYNYKIHNKGGLAIIKVLEEWYHFLKDAKIPVEI